MTSSNAGVAAQQGAPVRTLHSVPGLVPEAALRAADWLRGALPVVGAMRADSRSIRPGDVFVAFPGQRTDGRSFVGEAVARGASAVLYERDGAPPLATGSTPALAVERLRDLAGPIASELLGRPSERMDVIAVTGTNGKTSTTQWIARGLGALGRSSAVVGTLGCGVIGSLEETGLTTPDALELQAMLARFDAAGVEALACEASSIGLDQGRLNGTQVTVAVFTNLSRDHLDYHQTMEAYAEAKARLFAWPGLKAAIVNGDDPCAPMMLEALERAGSDARRIVYGFAPGQHGVRGVPALVGERLVDDGSGLLMTISGDFGTADLKLGLLGQFNASNALAVAASWLAIGVEFDRVVDALQGLEPVPGRMQTIDLPEAPLAVIDYAHSPDALDNVLAALRPVALRRGGLLWCVFGAGGDRDTGKRPQMGFVAERGADRLVITSDNPRSESPFRIVSDIRAGLSREPALTELDREVAIRAAIRGAGVRDVVLVAGKGHEAWQEIAGTRHPFSDFDIVRDALADRDPRKEAAGV